MKKIVVVGGGVSGLFLSLFLLKKNHSVTLHEKTSSVGKKFLVAGKSDLNITNSEPINNFFNRYNPRIDDALKSFTNEDLISFLQEEFDIETFVGSSARVFPKEIKASKILKMITDSLKKNSNFSLYLNSSLQNFSNEKIVFSTGEISEFDACVFCLGGASWKVTGSDGEWASVFRENNIETTKFEASNCSVELELSDFFKDKISHHFLKNIRLECEDVSVQGDIVFNGSQLEGTPIYTMAKFFRNKKKVCVNFKPDIEPLKLKSIIINRDKKQSIVKFLKSTLKVDPIIYSFWREYYTSSEINANLLELITSFEITNFKLASIDEAISTIGGIEMSELNSDYRLNKYCRYYSIGEMLNWDTITGGYLIQACVSQAYQVARSISK